MKSVMLLLLLNKLMQFKTNANRGCKVYLLFNIGKRCIVKTNIHNMKLRIGPFRLLLIKGAMLKLLGYD